MFFTWITLSGKSQSNGRTGRGSSFVPKMLVRLLCVVCVSGVIKAFDPYTDNELDTARGKSNGFSSANDDTVKRFWGISDSTALVGQIFNFTVSKDAFSGKVRSFVVSEAGESKLPSWLRFDPKTRSFQGIPLEKDVGQYYISVKAQGSPHGGIGKNVAKDVSSIDVVDDSPDANNPGGTTQKCVTGEVLTVASVIFDADLDSLSPESRIGLLERAANVMKILPESLKLKPLAANSRAFDTSAIMAGPGNARASKTPGAILQWQVGCSGVVSPDQSERITEIEKMSKDGTLGDELNHPVVGWHVTNRQQQTVVRREKRQAHHAVAGTPVPGIFPTRWPHSTERVDEYTDETNAPESRIVPTMVSPIFSSSSHHHRHEHGRGMAPGERGHHKHIESVRITASPVLPRYATPYASIVGTPILPPQRPSTYDGTLITLTHTRPLPEEHTPMMTPSTTPIVTPVDVGTIKPSSTDSGLIPTIAPPGKLPNSRPTIQNRMKKLSIIAGKVWSYQIPKDTFVDLEDGDTSSLKLIFMTHDRTAISQSSWVQFDPVRQTLYALPLDENIGKYQFILEAMDSGGETVQDMLDIHVRQHPGQRAVHHTFTLALVSPKWKYPVAIDWEIEVVKKLAKLYGDRNTSQITVKDVTTTDPLRISWTNDSLPRHPCPRERIERLASKLIKDQSGHPTHHLTKILGKEIKVDEASVTYTGVCEPTVPTTDTTRKTDSSPEKRNPIEQVNATVGEILRFRVPEDTFYDEEDGSTRYLKLLFLTIDSALVPKSSWVQLNLKSQELYGLPFEGDVGQHEFIMTAQDSDGRTVNDAFMILVQPRVPRKASVEFSIHLDANYDEFNRNISQKVLVAWKLSKMYGDPDPRYITVKTISKGSVVYLWTNNTLPRHPCPKEKIAHLVSYLMNDNETISNKLVDAMQPEFRVIKVDTIPMDVCLNEMTITTITAPPGQPSIPPIQESEPTATNDDDVYITTIIPAVVIAIMLIIAAMVACFLYRKKRKGKMTMNENGAFVTKGIPIIFADELDEKNDPAKPPIILREEKPPLAPMDYPRSISASSRDSTPQTDRKEVANIRDTNADLHHPDPHFSPPYQPPPPFTTSRDNKNSRPKATPTYRQPPPYVPP